jgi:hypothetical protein
MWCQNADDVAVASRLSSDGNIKVSTKNMVETLRSALIVDNDCQSPITMAFPIVSEKVTMSNRVGCLPIWLFGLRIIMG